jgi:hypothetical protein
MAFARKKSAANAAALSRKRVGASNAYRLLRGIAQSHFDALVDAALVARRCAALDVAFAGSTVDQRKGAVHDCFEIAVLFGGERAAHGANLVAESGPRETIKDSTPLGLTDPLERLNTICHLLLCILLIEFDLPE